MSIWSTGRRGKSRPRTPATVPARGLGRVAVVEFWAADHRTVAALDLNQERLTDLLNREDVLSVIMLDTPPEDRSQRLEPDPGKTWSQLEVGESLLVLPPPQPANPDRRLHRPRQPVEVLIGPFVASPAWSMWPGAQAAAFLFRHNGRFAAVTRAAIRDRSLTGFEQRADVVLVNMRRISSIQDVALDEGGALVPPDASLPSS